MSSTGCEVSRVMSLLYAGPGSAVCRTPEGRLVVCAPGEGAVVVLTQEELLERGVGALLDLVA